MSSVEELNTPEEIVDVDDNSEDEEFQDGARPYVPPTNLQEEEEDDEDDEYDEIASSGERGFMTDSAETTEVSTSEPTHTLLEVTNPDVAPEDQKSQLKALQADRPKMVEGDTWYLLNSRWYDRWKSYVQFDRASAYDHPKPSAIENECLLSANGSTCKKGLYEHYNYALLPKQEWELLVSWYGGGPAIGRPVIATGYNGTSIVVEVRPLCLKILRSGDPTVEEHAQYSKCDTVGKLKKEMCARLGLEEDNVRVWDYHARSRIGLLEDSSRLDSAQIIDDQFVLLEEKGADGKFPEVKQPAYQSSTSYYSRSSYSSSYSSYNNRHIVPTDPGKTGLNNLGNTCFMNSSLQCLSNSCPLTNFFRSQKYKDDLNPDNPLGTGGELAKVYAELLEDLWCGKYSSTAPRSFKSKLERFATQFAGYQQHDSQELLAYLLDGLHEDVNRVREKPPTTTEEANGRPDEIVAKEAWDVHLLRNDSIIVDWFQGQLKSTLVCPDCDRVSVTFDPMMYLSLPLPMKTTKSFSVTFFFEGGEKLPIKCNFNVEKTATMKTLKQLLSEHTNVPANCIALADVFGHRFHRRLKDYESVTEIEDNDDIFAYELRLPAVPPRTYRTAETTDTKDNGGDAASEDTSAVDGEDTPITDNITSHQEEPSTATGTAGDSDDGFEETNFDGDTYGMEVDDEQDTRNDDEEDEETLPLDHPNAIVHLQVVHRRDEVVKSLYSNHTYNRKTLFGIPETASVNPMITYDELYDYCMNKFRRFIDLESYQADIENWRAEKKAGNLPVQNDASESDYSVRHTRNPPSIYSDHQPMSEDDEDDDGQPWVGDVDDTDAVLARVRATHPESLGDACDESEVADDDGDDDGDDGVSAISDSESNTEIRESSELDAATEEDEEDEEDYAFFEIHLCDAYGTTDIRTLHDDVWDVEMWRRYYKVEAENDMEETTIGASDDNEIESQVTLKRCLDLFTKQEKLGPEDPWYCNKCKEFVQATKKFDLWRLPPVLVIHLKRFSYESRYFRDKLDIEVSYPLENLDLSDYQLFEEPEGAPPPIYDLYAVSNHFGSQGGGHYTAFAKNRNDGKWYNFDDSHVSEASESSVCSNNGYVLFYRRRGYDEEWAALETDKEESDADADTNDKNDTESDEGEVGTDDSPPLGQSAGVVYGSDGEETGNNDVFENDDDMVEMQEM